MTTYTLTGLAIERNYIDDNEFVVSVGTNNTLELVVPDATTTFSYTVNPLFPGDEPGGDESVEIDLNDYEIRLNGSADAAADLEVSIFRVGWLDAGNVARVSTVLLPFDEANSSDVEYVFVIDGAPLPPISSVAQWNALEGAITSVTIPTGSYGPGVAIPLASIGATSSENDMITGDANDNEFDGGAGNDTILGLGGDDTLIGGDGDDSLNPGDNFEGWEFLTAGAGQDTIDFSDMTSGAAGAGVYHSDLNAGILATVNANTNTAFVNKGANGSTTILNVQNAILGWGLGVGGSDFDDTINITQGSEGYIEVTGRKGVDTFNINSDGGHIRIDAAYWDATTGVVADLSTGIIANDGFGSSDIINGVENVSSIRSTMNNDNITGSSRNDIFILMAGNDTVDGGDGFDLLRYDRNQVEAVNVNLQTGTATGRWRGEDFIHTISNIETVRGSREGNDIIIGNNGVGEQIKSYLGDDHIFGDGAAATYYGSAIANQVYRLYQATLDRLPDVGGHAAWAGRIASGERTLLEVTEGFVGSPEFQQTYGNADDSQFVTLLYNNVLDSDPDAGGLARWTGELANGASRAQVVLGFAESPQFTTETTAAANSYAARSLATSWSDEVFRLYQATLDRAPDGMGQTNWAGRLASGERTLLEVAEGFVGSPEFQQTYGNADDTQFVTLLYNNVLDSDPDANGLARWTGDLTNGASRAEVVLGFSQSPQFTAETVADLKTWMRDQGEHDRIEAGAGTNVVAGGQFADTFVFDAGADGATTLRDLEVWDYIDLNGFGYTTQAQARAEMSQAGSHLVFNDQGVQITFENTTLAQITDDMILI